MSLTNEALHQKSPQQLTALLYEACYTNLEKASESIQSKDFIDANIHLQKASDIIHRLGAGINYEAGIIADQLEQLYNYIADCIVEANYKKDATHIQAALNVLTPIMASWNEALKSNQDSKQPQLKRQTSAYDQLSMYE